MTPTCLFGAATVFWWRWLPQRREPGRCLSGLYRVSSCHTLDTDAQCQTYVEHLRSTDMKGI